MPGSNSRQGNVIAASDSTAVAVPSRQIITTSLRPSPGIMVYSREIIPKWPNYSGWWIMIICPDLWMYAESYRKSMGFVAECCWEYKLITTDAISTPRSQRWNLCMNPCSILIFEKTYINLSHSLQISSMSWLRPQWRRVVIVVAFGWRRRVFAHFHPGGFPLVMGGTPVIH